MALRRACGRLLHMDDLERLETCQRLLGAPSPPNPEGLGPRERRLVRVLVAPMVDRVIDKTTTLDQACALLWRHPQVLHELRELLDVLSTRIGHIHDQSAYLAAAYAHLGDLDSARRHVAQFLATFQEKITFCRPPLPEEPLAYLLDVNPFTRAEDASFLVDGLQKAGLIGAPPACRGRYLPPDTSERGTFHLDRDTECWTVAFANRTMRIKSMKGCRDLALLLSSPGERFHCMEIAGRMLEGDAGSMMDARGRAEAQRRIRELREEIEDAEQMNDAGREAAARGELDALIEQLGAALGLGGRSRKVDDPIEKARTAVTWRIRSAIKKIGAEHPELGRHLTAAVRTGAFCVYEPERATVWTM